MDASLISQLATVLFALAVLHTLAASRFQRLAARFAEGSVGENLFHLLGEVEVVFGLWAGLLIAAMAAIAGPGQAIAFLESLNFTEPLFVFVIMAVAATRPLVELARGIIIGAAKAVSGGREWVTYVSCLLVGPLLGSLLTEPAAMTLVALILRARYYEAAVSEKFKYVTLAALFVNISIGGVLTHFAAPPVLMVAARWGWGLGDVFAMFGWKSVLAAVVNAFGAAYVLRRELGSIRVTEVKQAGRAVPGWLTGIHVLILAAVVATAHHATVFMGLFLFFLGVTTITKEYQTEIKLRESLLVGFFLAGLVVLGSHQRWWLDPVIRGLDSFGLFAGAALLTTFTDNAALTYLGSLIEGITDPQKYALVAGAVAAGGMTVIANAPNPAGYSILQDRFGEGGISALKLALYAAPPTLVAMAALWFL